MIANTDAAAIIVSGRAVRPLDCGSEGCGFKPRRPPHFSHEQNDCSCPDTTPTATIGSQIGSRHPRCPCIAILGGLIPVTNVPSYVYRASEIA